MRVAEPVSEIQLQNNPVVAEAIEQLESRGLACQLKYRDEIRDESALFGITYPLDSEQTPEAHNEFVLRHYPYANGLHHRPQQRLDSLVSQVTQRPVIAIPAPSRSWYGTHEVADVEHWLGRSKKDRQIGAYELLTSYATSVRDSLGTVGLLNSGIKIDICGDSLGAATALGLGLVLRHEVDVSNVSILALPNVVDRPVWSGLFRDYVKSIHLPGGIYEQARQGIVPFDSFIKAHGFWHGEPSPYEQLKSSLDYLFHDMVGGLGRNTYHRNRAFTRALSTSVGVDMARRLASSNGTIVDIGFFEHDPVAPYYAFERHMAPLADVGNLRLRRYENRDHAGCNNPYIIGDMALKLVESRILQKDNKVV